jgi:hypothetical protein
LLGYEPRVPIRDGIVIAASQRGERNVEGVRA